MYYYENMELRKFVEVDQEVYAVDYEITNKNKIYLVAIRKLTQKLTDEQMNENNFQIKYDGSYYSTNRVSGTLKFKVSEKKKQINWTYRTGGVVFNFDKYPELKCAIEDMTKEIKLSNEYEQLVFSKAI